jgi:hypothetical protein
MTTSFLYLHELKHAHAHSAGRRSENIRHEQSSLASSFGGSQPGRRERLEADGHRPLSGNIHIGQKRSQWNLW